MFINPYGEDFVGLLSFDDEGWLVSNAPEAVRVVRVPTPNKWTGMHPDVAKNYGNKLLGMCTHYDALGGAARTAKGFSVKGGRSASTHGVIDRESSLGSEYADIYVLASIHDRTWHAGFDFDRGDAPYQLPNGVTTKSPNQWFIGWDLSNWGDLRKDDQGNWCAWPAKNKDSKPYTYPVILKKDYYPESVVEADGKFWEPYTLPALNSYKALVAALALETGMTQEWHVRHSDLSPKRKMDPGPHFPFHELLTSVYEEVHRFKVGEFLDLDRSGDPNSV
jgi:N-acetyl-anhydromuramyl-L-alanine amidase AmpD